MMNIKIGDKFNCYDDGKVRPSRHSVITITEISTYNKLSKESKQSIKNIIADDDLFNKKQTDIIAGKDCNNRYYLFLKTTYNDWYSIEHWGPGLLDVTGEYTINVINDLNNNYYDYSPNDVEYIISCLNNKEEINLNNPTKIIKNFLSI